MKKWTLNLLHLSHTDIGYTDTQPRILKNQINYLRELVENYKKDKSKFEKWTWTAEAFFIVDRFLKEATEEEVELLDEMVKKNIISISASFLNMAELISTDVYDKTLQRTMKVAKDRGWVVDTAICNDVNGFSYGWASALAKNKVKNLYFGLHTHHGMYPGFKKQSPFMWETKNGEKIMTWVGEHYQLGTELGLVDAPMGNYILQSDFEDGYFPEERQISEGKKRIKKYLENLEKDGYQFENVPVSILGAPTDNAPYNLSIADRVAIVNKEWADLNIEVKMVTLTEFFENIKAENKEIPTYKGDWPDWWTDGTGSKPQTVRLFRQAQRNHELITALGIDDPQVAELEHNLLMYAEHTFGTWDSIEIPTIFENLEIDHIKSAFAAKAQELSSSILDKYTNRKVFKLFNEDEVKIKVINPFASTQQHVVKVEDFFGWKESERFAKGLEVFNGDKKVKTIKQVTTYMNIPFTNHYAFIELEGNEEITLTVKEKADNAFAMTRPQATMAADRVSDFYNPLNNDRVLIHNKKFENDFVSIKWDENGINSVISKATGEELLDLEQEGLFTPVYEVGDMPYNNEQMNLQRRHTGRNRKAWNTKRYIGKLDKIKVINEELDRTVIDFYYDVKSMKQYLLRLVILNDAKRIDVKLKLIKEVEWSLENVYVSLPFAKATSQVKFDKGEMFEIWKEQIKGTLIDYYAIQGGIQVNSSKETVLISTKDNHLFWTGDMDYQKRFLAGDPRNEGRPCLYGWLMNNAWETNFQASLAGFHEFNYSIYLPGKKLADDTVIDELKVMNDTLIVKRG